MLTPTNRTSPSAEKPLLKFTLPFVAKPSAKSAFPFGLRNLPPTQFKSPLMCALTNRTSPSAEKLSLKFTLPFVRQPISGKRLSIRIVKLPARTVQMFHRYPRPTTALCLRRKTHLENSHRLLSSDHQHKAPFRLDCETSRLYSSNFRRYSRSATAPYPWRKSPPPKFTLPFVFNLSAKNTFLS